MSLYERMDRHAAPGRRGVPEYRLLYAICFALLLIPVALRRLNPRGADDTPELKTSIIAETSAMASICAASSFAGM
jgi:hypothetical protein